MTEVKRVNYSKKEVEIHNSDDISFPTICIVCGKETKSNLRRSFYGRLYDNNNIKRKLLLFPPLSHHIIVSHFLLFSFFYIV